MVVNHSYLVRAIFDAKIDAEFQFYFAGQTSSRLQKLDASVRITAASLTILAAFLPKMVATGSPLPQVAACLAAIAALFVSIPKWSIQLRESVMERDRWISIFTELEQVDTSLRISGDYEHAFKEFERIQKNVLECTKSKNEMPNWSGIKKKCEQLIHDKYADEIKAMAT